ncbi:Thioredoxin-like domain-containing protein [Chitinophaga terrae (ex Kim and Jung 2007)]|uniref:Thioredoxin-like domain-containing protein n=1 Tax=Chitinophaga terrae (ex Kim and Jung 2007) TaxID=408074 RepID=A0A1H3X8W2_9BACT|nr:thioredoxin fold domain-containing protein [Chitinophaga terrae (ex Kim and Jung 2007)]GEP89889.1 hypothetical protein CTE07_15340 [Chitinophaga terrae (ex Kim and Jung 2007)]SDZ95094.1 Thioredoxin-like domain-containing protein [Chitinophaga terrae (ex Kim and Jung 2007)]
MLNSKVFIIVVISFSIFFMLDVATSELIKKKSEVENYNKPLPNKAKGKKFPSFPLLVKNDSAKVVPVDFARGRNTVVLYFDPYCPTCKKEIQEITANIQKLKSIYFIFISPYPSYQISKTINEFSLLRYENILVGRDNDHLYGDYYGVSSVPLLVVYDKNMIMKDSYLGLVKLEQLLSLY